MPVRLNLESQHLSLVSDNFDQRRPLDAAPLQALTRRYAAARETSDRAALLNTGQELYAWLDGKERWLPELRKHLQPPFLFEIRAPRDPSPVAWTGLNAPWELLADQHGFLAADAELRYAPARRLGSPKPPPPLDDYRLGIAFMAAAPRGAQELDFEAEESAIMTAASGDLDLLVEESGDPEQLGRRLSRLKPTLPVLHLSCHGHNAWPGQNGNTPQPVLMLEDPTGAQRPVTAGKLFETLGNYHPALIFLSACLTAAGEPGATAETGLSNSLASRLVQQVPAVLGWDGSVADVAATAFAQMLYDELGKAVPLPLAAATARRTMLNAPPLRGGETEALTRDWHLARIWLGPEGGGPIAEGSFERSLIPPDGGHKILLDARGAAPPVANPAMFVGRRRELQRALRILNGRDKAGLLLHGMGRLGKSSLAARIIDRRPDLTRVVVFGSYGALDVAEALASALRAHEPATQLIAERKKLLHDDPDHTAFRALLVQLLTVPCKWANDGGRPLLLLIDDLEQILEADPNGARHHVRDTERPMIAALLHAFDPNRTNSRLLLTSRFPFTLTQGGRDLAESLAELELSEFSDTAGRKLALRQIKAAQAPPEGAGLTDNDLQSRLPLLARAQGIARGNPGLQDLLGADFVLRPAIPLETAATTLDEIKLYLHGGALPQTEAVREFLENLAIDTLLNLAGPAGRDLLRALTLFGTPIPDAVLATFHEIGGNPQRLRDLGLLVPVDDLVTPGVQALSVNGLAAGRLKPLNEAEQTLLAELALPALFAAWGGAAGRRRRTYATEIELTSLALLARDAEVLMACAADAVEGSAHAGQPEAAGRLGDRAVTLLEAAGHVPPLDLLARTATALQTAGDGTAAEFLLAKGKQQAGNANDDAKLQQLSTFLFVQGDRQNQKGDLDGAMTTFQRLCEIETKRGAENNLAVARGHIADILQGRGELDEALRIHTEEQLPVYTRLGDVRAAAVTRGKIADVLHARGELDEALRIHTEEELPVYARLGDFRAMASTKGKIADIVEVRGDLAEAVRIRIDEQLPVYARLGEVRLAAVTKGRVADTLQACGDLDQALRIRIEEQLPAYTRLGDVRAIAVCKGKIADILKARGDLDGALRICSEEELPVYIRLGDVRAAAIAKGRIADILQALGNIDEALRLRTEEQLPIYTRLGDVRSAAVVQGRIADILQARGDSDAAMTLHKERLEANRRLGSAAGIAASLWAMARIKLDGQQYAAALPLLMEAWPLVVKLGRPDGIAAIGLTFGQMMLAFPEHKETAHDILRRSAAAYRVLKQFEDAEKVERLIDNTDERN